MGVTEQMISASVLLRAGIFLGIHACLLAIVIILA
jgi:hypothetical protein